MSEEKKSVESKKEKDENKKDATKTKKRKSSKIDRRAEREAILKELPKVDEHGISYTKLELRRMRKRVKRGLPPLETEEEKSERLRRDKELRLEEEAELAGMIYQRPSRENEEEDNAEEENNHDSDNMDDQDPEPKRQKKEIEEEQVLDNVTEKNEPETNEKILHNNNKNQSNKHKKKPRAKPVPSDYVCQACKNAKDLEPHWIYDCPFKVTTTKRSSQKQHENEPSVNKVFCSGLFFGLQNQQVKAFFQKHLQQDDAVVNCKILTFADSGRCTGQAIVTLKSPEVAAKARALSGTTIHSHDFFDDESEENQRDAKDDATKQPSKSLKRSSLKLKVTKLLSRSVTKRKQQYSSNRRQS